MNFQSAMDLISQSSKIALCTHINPDPDAYGSMCGLQMGLQEKLGSSVDIRTFNASGADPDHLFLPGVSLVTSMPESNWVPDIVIYCDCGDEFRIGKELYEWVQSQSCPILNFDHHSSNQGFGKVNLIDTTLSSTSELVYKFLMASDVSITSEIAQCLLAGIIGDTGGFRYRSNTADTMRAAAHLVDMGASLHELTAKLYGSVPLSTIRLESYAFQQLRISQEGRLAGVVISEEEYEQIGASSADGEMLAEKIRDIQDVVISYSIRWMDNGWKVSLRTCSEDVDLTRVAKQYGGGGHHAAAAFRFSDPPSVVVPKLEEGLAGLL